LMLLIECCQVVLPLLGVRASFFPTALRVHILINARRC
jgi:hypothetical protein